MSDRLLRGLLVVLGALVAVYAVVRLTAGGPDEPSAEPFGLAATAELELDSVVIASDQDTVRLRRGAEGAWTVNGHEALAETAESLKRGLEDARVGRLAARNPETHDRLGVGESAGRRVTFYSGGASAVTLVIGDRATGFDAAYVRRAGENEVYVVEGTLVVLTRRGVDEWRDKVILAVDREEIRRIELVYPDGSVGLTRAASGWTLEPSGRPAKTDIVANMLGELTGLRALGFAADSVVNTLSWETPTARVRVLSGGDDRLLGEVLFLSRGDTGYYARRGDGTVVYTVSRFSGDRLLKREGELIAPPDEAGTGSQAEEEGTADAEGIGGPEARRRPVDPARPADRFSDLRPVIAGQRGRSSAG